MITNIINFVKSPTKDCLTRVVKELSPISKYALLGNPDKILLHELSKQLADNSVVVEIGIYLGASSAIIAHANPKLEIHSYDLFDNYAYDDTHELMMKTAFGSMKDRSLENVASLLTQYSNITLHQVEYLKEPAFDKPIDLLVEDASHLDPQLSSSLNTWLPRVKVNGIALIHDYRPWLEEGQQRHFPDVIRYVDMLSETFEWQFHGGVGSYAVFERVA
jgi:predicted O-methyltransferase YrrM